MSFIRRSALAAAMLSVSALLAPALVSAQDPAPGLGDLQGLGEDAASRTLGARGYVRQSASDGYGSWWHARDRRCVMVRSDAGRVASVVTAPAPDCGQAVGTRPHEGMRDGTKAAVAAAAILGIAALSHQAHHHDDGEHRDDARHEADYERGYRDGLYGYRAERDGGTYSDGYGAGLRERATQVPWQQSSGPDASTGSRLDDLIGARAPGADTQLRARGFIDRQARQRDGRSIVTWWNAGARECVDVATGNGRIESIRSVDAAECR